jgi:hypothetical protein
MLHGNLLLRGWTLSDVSFYTTELPQYMLVELVRGLNQDVVHVAAAMTYTLAMLLAALLAKGSCTGREAVARAGIAAGIMLAPQLDSGTKILLSSPDHIGTSVPVMVVWLVLDRARPRWYIPVVTAALLGWATMADELVVYIGVLPLALVCAVRVYRSTVTQRQPLTSRWYDIALGAGAFMAAAAATLALHIIHDRGGFLVLAPGTQFAQGAILPRNLGNTAEGLLLLGGADFFGLRLSASTAIVMLHMAGVVLAGWGTCLAARRFPQDRDLVAQLLVAAVVINLLAYVLSTNAYSVSQTREIAAVLPFSAALAGRLLAARLMAARLVPVLVIVLLGYLGGLVHEISRPPVPAQNQQLASWLAARHLRTGLSGYWESNIVTLASGGQVRIRAVETIGGVLAHRNWESDADWFNPDRDTAGFVVIFPGIPGGYTGFTSTHAALATFGAPARTYHVGAYTVLIWNKNLLTELH